MMQRKGKNSLKTLWWANNMCSEKKGICVILQMIIFRNKNTLKYGYGKADLTALDSEP